MWIFDPPADLASSSLTPLSRDDEDLLTGAQSGTGEVDEVVVVGRRESGGGYVPDSIPYEYTDFVFQGEMQFVEWLNNEADNFVANHVDGDSNNTFGALVRDAIRLLWLNSYDGTWANVTPLPAWNAPLSDTLTQSELLAALDKIYIHIGAHGRPNPAETDPPNALGEMHIYIDENRLGSYTQAFGTYVGTNFVVYHELGHAMPDSRASDGSTFAFREGYASEYGQLLAEITGAVYLNDTQLMTVGGTVPRD